MSSIAADPGCLSPKDHCPNTASVILWQTRPV